MYPTGLDEVETDVDILEALDTHLRLGGIAAKGLIAEEFEEVYEDHLKIIVSQCFHTSGVLIRTPSERSVTRSLTATSRSLTFEFNLRRESAVSLSGNQSMPTLLPLAESLLLNSHPALLGQTHVREGIRTLTEAREFTNLSYS